MTPLHQCSDKSRPDALVGMEFCLANGADVNSKDGTGQTPLHYACHHAQYNCTTRMIRLLLNKGSDPNIFDNFQQQPTHVLEKFDRLDIPVMVELKDDINELLLEGVDSPSCFTQVFKCCQSLAVKKKFQKANPVRFEPLYICFFVIQVIVFTLFISYIRPVFEQTGHRTKVLDVLITACWVFFSLTMVNNLVLSLRAAGPIQ